MMKIKKIRSILKWYGGKYHLLNYILPFPIHSTYIEVFGGGGSILMNKIPSKVECFNDINKLLINFWMVLRDNRKELKETLEYLPDSRELFRKYLKDLKLNKEKIMDIDNAFKFFYINYHSYSASNFSYWGINFNPDLTLFHNPHAMFLEQIDRIDEIWKRIKYVHFECQDFVSILRRVDKPYTLIYLDPPYIRGGYGYEKGVGSYKWKTEYYYKLFKILKNLKKSKFVLSFDDKSVFDNPEWFYQKIKHVSRFRQDKYRKLPKHNEYIIRNFDPERTEIMRLKKNQTLLKYIRDV